MKSSVRLLVSLLGIYRANLDRIVAKQVLKDLEELGKAPDNPLLNPNPLTKNKKLPGYPSFPIYTPKYTAIPTIRYSTTTTTNTANPCQEIFLQNPTW